MTETNIQLGASFDTIAPDAKAWVYTCKEDFTESQISEIEKYGEVFLSQWDSHGKMVKGNIQILKNRFIAIFADTEGDTMCGSARDASVRFVKELEEILSVTLMDRMCIAFKDGEEIKTLPFNELRSKLSSGNISKNSKFYNGLVQSKEEFLTNWEIPIEGSWL